MSVAVFLALTATAFAVDNDGDGFHQDDCDDSNPLVNPDGLEGTVADGVDQDCSGTADDVLVCPGQGGAPTIQAGVDAAGDGFVVRICEGHYREAVRVVGRELELRSEGSKKKTGINGEGSAPSLSVLGGAHVTVRELTLFNGASPTIGGGLRCVDSIIDIADSRIMRSMAADGGGLGADGCQVTVDSVQFRDNTATGDGGNLWLDDSTGVVTSSLIDGGLALQGGGLFVDGGLIDIASNTFTDNTATSTANDYVGGGGAHLSGDSTLTGNVLSGNHAEMCGGGAYLDSSYGDVLGNIISENTASDDGGGIYFDWSYATVGSNTIIDNSATDDAGGLRVYYGDMVVEDNLIQGNSANDDGGGAKMSHAVHIYRRNVHRGNSTGDAGGGLEMDNDSSHVEDCTFDANSAGRGGGLHSWRNEAQLDIRSSTFTDNVATGCGGAMAFDNDEFEVTLFDLELDGNHSDNDGGSLCMEYREQDDGTAVESVVRLQNSVVRDSSAADEGGLVKVSYGLVIIDNSVIYEASAGQGAHGLADEDGVLSIRNSVLLGASGGTILDQEVNGVVNVGYTDVFDSTGGFGAVGNPIGSNGNLSVDPGFVSPTDLHLAAGSALIDAGDPNLLDSDGSISDIGVFGGPRALP